ncbi:unnamed protein product [marine sediment metagenome]|uniref:YozE SAM-like domain-containing protein n=1 Tax=marine sediment metagenome TaxID=412755 RepID=X0ZMM8_9ZZZZ
MNDFWTTLLNCVELGEMDLEEAHSRHNYWCFARRAPCIKDPEAYVLEAASESLPPVTKVPSMQILGRYVEHVREGEMGPYDAAQAYFDEVEAW